MIDSQRFCDNIVAIPSELTKGCLLNLFLCLFLSLLCLFLSLLRLFLSLLCLLLFPLSLQKECFIICKIVAGHRVCKVRVKECYCQFDLRLWLV